MKTIEAVIVILIVALGASLIFNYSFYTSNQQLKSAFNSLNETELIFPLSASATNESLGLSFSMAINTTLLQSGQAISITLNETNTHTHFNNITALENWSYSGFERQLGGDINLLNRPFTVAIVGGYYTTSELEGTNSLPIFSSPAIIYLSNYAACLGGNCITIPPTEYDFYPSSSFMIINYNQSWGLPPLNESASSSMSFSGYYDNSSWNVTHEFTPGVYTVIGGDEWGQLVLLHFLVSYPPQWNSSLGTSLGNLYNDIQGPVSTLSYQGNLSLGTGPDLCIQGPVQIFDPPITYTFNNQTDGRLPDNYRGLYFGNDLFGMPNPPQGNSSSGTPLGEVK